MATISSLYGVKEVSGALVGLELEVEGSNLPAMDPEGAWKAVADHSLRGGIEYIFKAPLGSVRTKAALEEMKQSMAKYESQPSYSFRTSTHVHVNVSNLDKEIVEIMLYLHYVFEDEFLNFCARSRRANRFCLGMKDATDIVNLLYSFFRNNNVTTEDRGKYCALNMCTLMRYGTLEFRSLEGTDNWDRIYTWVRALLSLRKAAKEIGSTKELFKLTDKELADRVFATPRLKEQFLKDGWESRVALNKSIGITAFRVLEDRK